MDLELRKATCGHVSYKWFSRPFFVAFKTVYNELTFVVWFQLGLYSLLNTSPKYTLVCVRV